MVSAINLYHISETNKAAQQARLQTGSSHSEVHNHGLQQEWLSAGTPISWACFCNLCNCNGSWCMRAAQAAPRSPLNFLTSIDIRLSGRVTARKRCLSMSFCHPIPLAITLPCKLAHFASCPAVDGVAVIIVHSARGIWLRCSTPGQRIRHSQTEGLQHRQGLAADKVTSACSSKVTSACGSRPEKVRWPAQASKSHSQRRSVPALHIASTRLQTKHHALRKDKGSAMQTKHHGAQLGQRICHGDPILEERKVQLSSSPKQGTKRLECNPTALRAPKHSIDQDPHASLTSSACSFMLASICLTCRGNCSSSFSTCALDKMSTRTRQPVQ